MISSPHSLCSARVIQIQPQEYADVNDNHTAPTYPHGHPALATSTHITTTVQAFTQCDSSGRHVVTILPPTQHVFTTPSTLLPANPLGSQIFTPASSTRDLLAQLDESKGAQECVPLPICRWNLSSFARDRYAPILLQSQTKVGSTESFSRGFFGGGGEGSILICVGKKILSSWTQICDSRSKASWKLNFPDYLNQLEMRVVFLCTQCIHYALLTNSELVVPCQVSPQEGNIYHSRYGSFVHLVSSKWELSKLR